MLRIYWVYLKTTLALQFADLSSYGEVVASEGSRNTLRVPKVDTPQVTARLLADLPVSDLTVEDPPIEDVIEQVFAGALEGGEPSEPSGAP
jgi:ABC-2 type transport system ATP-binding protein